MTIHQVLPAASPPFLPCHCPPRTRTPPKPRTERHPQLLSHLCTTAPLPPLIHAQTATACAARRPCNSLPLFSNAATRPSFFLLRVNHKSFGKFLKSCQFLPLEGVINFALMMS